MTLIGSSINSKAVIESRCPLHSRDIICEEYKFV